MDIAYEKDGISDQLMLLLCSIFDQIYITCECLDKHHTCVYYLQDSTNIKNIN